MQETQEQKEQRRDRLRQEAERGRRWEAALACLDEYMAAEEKRLIGEIIAAKGPEDAWAAAIRLRCAVDFLAAGQAYARQGKIAEEELRQDGE